MGAETRTWVSDLQVAALRALLAGDPDYEMLTRQAIAESQPAGYGELGLAAFMIAVRQRFSPEWSPADVIGYIAVLRTRLSRVNVELEPGPMEALIQQALGRDSAPAFGNAEIMAEDLLLVLADLVCDVRVAPTGLDGFLARARTVADARLAERVF